MSKIVEELKKDAQIIIIDSPPVTAVTDSSVLAPRMDGVLLVIQPGITKLDAARHAVEQLRRVKANLIGVVLNNVEPRSSRYGYYYRYDRAYYAEEDAERMRALRARRGLRWAVVGSLTALIIGVGGWFALTINGGLPVWLGGVGTRTPTRMPVAAVTTVVPAPTEMKSSSTPALQSTEDAVVLTDVVDVAQSPTQTPTITPTLPPPTPGGPGLYTPFGPQQAYMLHQVKYGDNLPNLADQYQTDRDVIVAANGLLPDVPLQPDQVIVIMPGLTDSIGIEHLIAHFLGEDTSINELAPRYGVTVEEIRHYNQFGPGEIIPAGRWLIIPRREVTPTATPTAIPTPDLSYALTEPFGPNAEYVLHKVAQGEGTYSIEGLYLTSSAVIRALNGFDGALQPEQILVILLERRDPSGITPLSVFYVEEALQVEAVADYLGIYTADLLFYNNLQAGEIIPAGRYVIYPTPLEEE